MKGMSHDQLHEAIKLMSGCAIKTSVDFGIAPELYKIFKEHLTILLHIQGEEGCILGDR